jgi:hypothetical protein
VNIEDLMYDTEREWTDEHLDLPYIADVAEDVARALRGGKPAEVAYQPGDGTSYGLVFTPLSALERARPRVKDGRPWNANAVSGMGYPAYEPGGYLVSHVENVAYPVRLGDRGVLSASYIEEHWKLPLASAVSVALLLRAISAHLDALGLHSV